MNLAENEQNIPWLRDIEHRIKSNARRTGIAFTVKNGAIHFDDNTVTLGEKEDENAPWFHEAPELRKSNIKALEEVDVMSGENERAWVPLQGDSMTSDIGLSIPSGSLLQIKRVPFDVLQWPMRKPICIAGTFNGKPFVVCKIITFVDEVANCIKCESLNPKYKPFWVGIEHIRGACVVEGYEHNGKRYKIK